MAGILEYGARADKLGRGCARSRGLALYAHAVIEKDNRVMRMGKSLPRGAGLPEARAL